jgi:hypothetical protein
MFIGQPSMIRCSSYTSVQSFEGDNNVVNKYQKPSDRDSNYATCATWLQCVKHNVVKLCTVIIFHILLERGFKFKFII